MTRHELSRGIPPKSGLSGRGLAGISNIGIHSQKLRQQVCKECGQTYSERKGTAFYRLHRSVELVTIVMTLLAYGCPLQAIVADCGLDERTVRGWQSRAGQQCQRAHEHQVQLDKVRVKVQGGTAWLAGALPVPTRLWRSEVVSIHRDSALIVQLLRPVCACAFCRPLLFCTDGFRAYVSAIRQVLREAVPSGRP